MKNRFLELLLEKTRQAERKAISESQKLFPESDPTKYDPWIYKPSRKDKRDRD